VGSYNLAARKHVSHPICDKREKEESDWWNCQATKMFISSQIQRGVGILDRILIGLVNSRK